MRGLVFKGWGGLPGKSQAVGVQWAGTHDPSGLHLLTSSGSGGRNNSPFEKTQEK